MIVLVFLIILGFLWRSADIKRVKGLDYQTESKVLRQFNNKIANDVFKDVKRVFVGNYMFLIDEYLVDSTKFEIIGQSNKYWAFSGHMHKLTFIGNPSLYSDRMATPSKLITIYDGHLSGGALPFFSIAFFCILATLAFLIRKENLPHIFTKNFDQIDESNE